MAAKEAKTPTLPAASGIEGENAIQIRGKFLESDVMTFWCFVRLPTVFSLK